MDNALQALRRVDFDWTAHIDQIWNDGPADVSSLQVDAREELDERLVALNVFHSVSNTGYAWGIFPFIGRFHQYGRFDTTATPLFVHSEVFTSRTSTRTARTS